MNTLSNLRFSSTQKSSKVEGNSWLDFNYDGIYPYLNVVTEKIKCKDDFFLEK
jgi:hypothetical protein